jgi:hypothetical protein
LQGAGLKKAREPMTTPRLILRRMMLVMLPPTRLCGLGESHTE